MFNLERPNSEAGTVFLFNDGLAFEIFGTVNAIGTEQNNIVFTSNNSQWDEIYI